MVLGGGAERTADCVETTADPVQRGKQMSAENGKVCCNCLHCIRSKDEKYGITICRCEKHGRYLSYAEVMANWCRWWAKKEEPND